MTSWILVYMLLVAYIATFGLFVNTFTLGECWSLQKTS